MISMDVRSVGFPDEHPPMESLLGVPIRVHDQVSGNLYLTNDERGEFSVEVEELVMSSAATADFAIENARLYRAAERRQEWLGQRSSNLDRATAGSRRNPADRARRHSPC